MQAHTNTHRSKQNNKRANSVEQIFMSNEIMLSRCEWKKIEWNEEKSRRRTKYWTHQCETSHRIAN